MDPIRRLQETHILMLNTMKSVQEAGIATPGGRQKFFALKETLLKHLFHEDQSFYPFLRQAAETDADLRNTLKLFAEDMERISQETLEFFDRYSQDTSGFDFAMDFSRIHSLLRQRILREEHVLFPAYAKATTQAVEALGEAAKD